MPPTPTQKPSTARRVLGLLVGLAMLGGGIHNVMQGVRSMRTHSASDALMTRPEPAVSPPRAWEACPESEVAYAQGRPGWTGPLGLDLTASWTLRQRLAAATAVYPLTLPTDAALPRDCAPSTGATFRRFIAIDALRGVAADETVSAEARVAAISESIAAYGGPATLYCGASWLDDYQWECARLTTSTLAIATVMVPLAMRAAAEDTRLSENEHFVHGLATVRDSIVTTGADVLRLLELPAGVRPGVRALLAHVLAEDFVPARALVTNTAALPPVRQRIVDLLARETQPEVHDALALALQNWP